MWCSTVVLKEYIAAIEQARNTGVGLGHTDATTFAGKCPSSTQAITERMTVRTE